MLTLVPANDYLVQLVAFRGTVWFLPVLLIASCMRSRDLTIIARGLSVLNLAALGGAIYVYQYGVESLYPRNAVTEIIYRSRDVAGFQYHRIPSFFLSAHAYGGAMLFSLPFLLDRLFGRGVRFLDRILAGVGTAAALLGILMCAARVPVVVLGIMLIIAWLVARLSPMIGILALSVVSVGAALALTDERLQRVMTLEESELISDRVKASAK
jgi:hypothetical protein